MGGDISKWDVSSVAHMGGMFYSAASFNADISEWDVSSATNMNVMFFAAISFGRTLSGAWFASEADQDNMFERSRGRISSRQKRRWTPRSRADLRDAIKCRGGEY